MQEAVGSAPSCAGYPSTRIGHAKCAVRNTLQAFSEVNFGLAQFASYMTGCDATCYNGCTVQNFPNNVTGTGCGPINGSVVPDTAGSAWSDDVRKRRGANILVPIALDTGTSPTNLANLLKYVDNNCTNNEEIVQINATSGIATPLNGVMRDMYRYFVTGWTRQDGAVTYPSPLITVSTSDCPPDAGGEA